MFPGNSRLPVIFRTLAQFCLAVLILIGTTVPLTAGSGALKFLSLKISARERTAKAEVPPGIRAVTLQRFERPGGWQKVASKIAANGRVEFRLPKAGKHVRWRAVGRLAADEEVKVEEKLRRKFPDNFYRGRSEFAPTLSDEFNEIVSVPSLFEPFYLSGFSLTSNAVDSITPVPVAVEADIWRTDGGTVYYFNQLRGLQVLDLSNPADPRLVATLRLPAVGEDLYLLPGGSSSRTLVLLTRVTGGESPATRINLVKVTGGVVEITHRQDVPGVLADSRLAGDSLALVATARRSGTFGWSLQPEDSRTSISQWRITPGKAPEAAGQAEIQGASPVIAAGSDWLAVAVSPAWDRVNSEVSVFSLGVAKLNSLTPVPVRTAGIVLDKFKMQWSKGVFTVISETGRSGSFWTQSATVLENFLVPAADDPRTFTNTEPPLLGRLDLAHGEKLHATRFAGKKAYIVTFRQTDPLWVVDLTDPAVPRVAGHLVVPGWSTYLEPIGDLLFSVGWESNTLAASLFDVADPASPKLLRRINLGTSRTYSEAVWNEKALGVLPEAGLVMIPLTMYREETQGFTPVVQLLDLDINLRDLKQRGVIGHEFDARRAGMIGQTVVSISQKALVAADIADRDMPEILSEVSLAWPVDRVLDAGAHLLQIESGGTRSGRATVRISPAGDTEAILAEVDLGDGKVEAAEVHDGKLFVLRDDGVDLFFSADAAPKRLLHLDVHDLAGLPSITLLGSCSVEIERGLDVSCNHLLWPRSNRPAVVLGSRNSFNPWFPAPIILPASTAEVSELFPVGGSGFVTGSILFSGGGINRWPYPSWSPRQTTKLLVFDTTDPRVPLAGQLVMVGTGETSSNGIYQAAGGLVVIGAAEWNTTGDSPSFGMKPTQSAHVLEVGISGEPVPRPFIDLPGALFAVSDLDRDGFLAFTRGVDAGGEPSLQASASDGFDAFEITALKIAKTGPESAGGRRLFLADDHGVGRFRLSDDGVFVAENRLPLGWKPSSLGWLDGFLIGGDARSIFAAEPQARAPAQWPTPAPGLIFENITITSSGDLVVPLGQYGAERLRR